MKWVLLVFALAFVLVAVTAEELVEESDPEETAVDDQPADLELATDDDDDDFVEQASPIAIPGRRRRRRRRWRRAVRRVVRRCRVICHRGRCRVICG